ncbi:MAG: ribbon-helix-helix domain-containing protein [Inquilinaceae bacterium]
MPTQTSALEPRILQSAGRRYSLKLEPVYWAGLEEIARDRKQRLNRLVASLAGELPPGASLASAVRAFCLTEAQRRATEARLAPGGRVPLAAVIDACPSAALVLGEDGTIRRQNEAFIARFGSGDTRFVGRPFRRFFQFRANVPLNKAWQDFYAGTYYRVTGRVVHVARGRVITATGRLHPMPARSPAAFQVVFWFE